jgi:hypothetical protein
VIWRWVPWRMALAAAVWLAQQGRQRVRQNLTKNEQSEFWSLVRRSRGRPSKLSERERDRLKEIVGKATFG